MTKPDARSGLADPIILLNGDAREIIPGPNSGFDLICLDADKDEYLDYYELVLPKVRKGGFILADNVIMGRDHTDENTLNNLSVILL